MKKGPLFRRVLETIDRHSMIRPGDRIGLGVSGGADSVALLRLFSDWKAQLGIELVVLHFHHQLRGIEADRDEEFVGQLARDLSLDFVPGRADVRKEARRMHWNLEDAARRLRYRFFSSEASARGLSRVAVAHTADDQAETVLAHVLRGTGPAGLAGIYPVAGLIIRPLLEVRRAELREYLSGLDQTWREDESNQDTSRMRSRIRHRLVPFLETSFEATTVTRLSRLAGLARDEEALLQAVENERFMAMFLKDATDEFSIGIGDLLSPLPQLIAQGVPLSVSPALALTRRLIRRVFFELRGSRQQLTARHVEDVLHLATRCQSGSRAKLPGVSVRRVFDRLIFSKGSAEKSGVRGIQRCDFEYAVPLLDVSNPICIAVPEIGCLFRLKVIDWPSASRETIMESDVLDLDRLRKPLVLRNWRPGDSYRPYGRRHVRKLKRLLLDLRVPFSNREGWPILTCDGVPAWARGCPVAHEFAPQSGTRSSLVIVEEKV